MLTELDMPNTDMNSRLAYHASTAAVTPRQVQLKVLPVQRGIHSPKRANSDVLVPITTARRQCRWSCDIQLEHL